MAASTALQVVVSPFLGLVFDNLNNLIKKEVGLIWGVDKEMHKLANTLSTIRDVLEDAEEKQVTNKAVANWLLKLRELAYDADDVLDEWATEAMQLQPGTDHATSSMKVCGSFFSCFHFEQVKFRHEMAQRVNELRKKFDNMASERSKFHLRGGVVERRHERPLNRETSSFSNDSTVYGRDEEKKSIVELLLNNVNSQEVPSVCPIVGIGGLGKTTVAQLCYNDQRVKNHFEVRIWVCVSDDFDVKKLTRAVIVSISGVACNIEELDPLQYHLQQKLAHKRFLLVLDDVWNGNQCDWGRFKNSLRCGARGSSVIVTTRLKTVASITGTCRPYSLNFLSENDCWCLFRQSAFGMGNEESSNLAKIGMEIVKKCGGVPLAAKVLGSLVRFKHDEKEWLFVRDSRIWDLPQNNDNTILPALRLSYTHLAPHLRQCFAYCSMFPKDHMIDKEELIRLWIANGLIQSKVGMQLEDIGNGIFNELLWRSFFQDEEKNSYGLVVGCKMHDLVHDLACSIVPRECCHLHEGDQIMNLPKGTRHCSVSFMSSRSSVVQSINQSEASLRTLILLSPRWNVEIFSGLSVSCVKFLRALTLKLDKMTALQHAIGNLKHLRYLDVSGSKIAALPESLCELSNLHTLKAHNCPFLKKLPTGMRNMSSLRHISIKRHNLREMPIEMGKLIHLQTLSIYIVGSDNGRCIRELQRLDNLSGEFEICGLEHVKTWADAREANLTRKQNLFSLKLTWSSSKMENKSHVEDVIQGLQPHSNVKSLCIQGYIGVKFPSWLGVSSLPNLVDVSLVRCKQCQDLPSSLGMLPLLRRLKMWDLSSVRFFTTDGSSNEFRSLEYLELYGMSQLEDWFPDTRNSQGWASPCLKELIIQNCPKLKRLLPSSLHLLENLNMSNCNELLLESIKNLPHLVYLKIDGFTGRTSFPEGTLQNLPSLRSLNISSCNALQSLPEVGSGSLRDLIISDCSSLTNVSQGLRYLTTLEKLALSRCPKVEISAVEYQQLNSLGELQLVGISSLKSLPDGL